MMSLIAVDVTVAVKHLSGDAFVFSLKVCDQPTLVKDINMVVSKTVKRWISVLFYCISSHFYCLCSLCTQSSKRTVFTINVLCQSGSLRTSFCSQISPDWISGRRTPSCLMPLSSWMASSTSPPARPRPPWTAAEKTVSADGKLTPSVCL